MVPLATERPTVPLFPDAAELVGVKSRQTAYRLAHAGKLPFRTLQVGRQLVVPTAELRRALGFDDPAPEPAQVPHQGATARRTVDPIHPLGPQWSQSHGGVCATSFCHTRLYAATVPRL